VTTRAGSWETAFPQREVAQTEAGDPTRPSLVL
jgi:hypothetical protein